MWLSIFLLALLLAGTYYLTIQGMTTALISCVLAVLCMALSFGTYEFVAEALLMKVLPDNYAYAVAFMATFVIPLFVLRVLMDIWVPRAHLLPQLVDKGLAGGFGFCASIVVVGMLAIGVQMLPWGGSIVGFQRINPEDPTEVNELWLKPDRVVATLASRLSSGVFSGSVPYGEDHPDLVDELGWIQTAPSGVSIVAPPDSVSLSGPPEWGRYVYAVPAASDKGGERAIDVKQSTGDVLVRVPLRLSSEAADSDNKQRFTLMMIRMVGDENGEPKMYHAVAIADPNNPSHHVRYMVEGGTEKDVAARLFSPGGGNVVDVAFEIPEAFKPRFVEYKLGGRVPLTKSQIRSPVVRDEEVASAAAPEVEKRAPRTSTDFVDTREREKARGGAGGGNVSGVKLKSSHFGDDLPMPLTAYQGYDTEIRDGVLYQGRIIGTVADQGEGGPHEIKKFGVPEGMRLLQLNVETMHANSIPGQALNYSVQTIENYYIEDDWGQPIKPVGKYAVADVGGTKYIEIEYIPEYAEMGGHLQAFQKIKNQNLRGDYQLVYLFLMKPGRQVMVFHTGNKAVNIGLEMLVAP